STVSVRTATTADVADIARIQRRTWRVAYAELLGEQALAQLDSPDVEQGWVATVEHVGTEVHLAIEADTIVGYCVTGPGPTDEIAAADGSLPDDAEAVGLIGDLLVEPRWGRRGHGGRLLATAAQWLHGQGITRGVTWVAQSDSASLDFFRRAGWHPDNTVRTLDTGGHTIREIRITGTLDLHLRD